MTTTAPPRRIRRDHVAPGMVVHSSHGYRILITEVIDSATNRSDDRHVAFKGHIHAAPNREIVTERYPAGSLIEVAPCTNPAHDHTQCAGDEVPAGYAPCKQCGVPQHFHTATACPGEFDPESGGVVTLSINAPMVCHDCGKPAHYDTAAESYSHDDLEARCFLHRPFSEGVGAYGGTLCTYDTTTSSS